MAQCKLDWSASDPGGPRETMKFSRVDYIRTRGKFNGFCVRPRCILTQSGHFGQTASRRALRTETLTDSVESLGPLKTQVAR